MTPPKPRAALAVGDRVRVYGAAVVDTGTVNRVEGQTLYYLSDMFGRQERAAHPKQCRKLVKRKAREVWGVFDKFGNFYEAGSEAEAHEDARGFDEGSPEEGPHKVVLMREVRGKGGAK